GASGRRQGQALRRGGRTEGSDDRRRLGHPRRGCDPRSRAGRSGRRGRRRAARRRPRSARRQL
ncbi:MAG: hypothetical protein AVDCRST_MAG79-2460, partial [uncultured Thermoleophilia bacterium]